MARRKRGVRNRLIHSDRLERSVTQANGAVGVVKSLWEPAEKMRARAEILQTWHDLAMRDPEELDDGFLPTLPDKAPSDVRKVSETSITPNAKSLIDQFSQQLRIEGIRLADAAENAPAWEIFERNGMGGKQVPLWKSQFLHGQAFAVALPAVGRLDGKKTAAFQLKSARRMTAFYRDDFDEFPEYAIDVDLVVNDDGSRENLIKLYDEDRVHTLVRPDGEPKKLEYITSEIHGMGITPVQRFGLITLDGEAAGEVEPYISLLKRIDQDTADRLVLQRFLSWMVRTATGVEPPKTEAEQALLEEYLSVGDLLLNASPDAKFGVLQGQPMDGHIHAREADMRDLASTSQVPAYRMLGLSDNIGAEAIAAADASLKRKMDEYKAVLGEQAEALMRLGGHAAGNEAIAGDFTSRTHWAVTENIDIQSLAQAIHQLNAEDRGVPFEMLWRWIPGWSQQDTQEALRRRQEIQDEMEARALMQAALSGGTDSGNDSGNAAGAAAPNGAGAAG